MSADQNDGLGEVAGAGASGGETRGAGAGGGDGLSAAQRATLRRILSEFADGIERVDLFGSRATGGHRPNSDLDLALHGALSEAEVDRLWTLLHESNLPFSVDVKSYAQTRYAPLRAHMDQVRKTLFTHEDLAREQTANAGGRKVAREGE
jgi:predicted nucleotidyltransferase